LNNGKDMVASAAWRRAFPTADVALIGDAHHGNLLRCGAGGGGKTNELPSLARQNGTRQLVIGSSVANNRRRA
jgi:hypothetical protein